MAVLATEGKGGVTMSVMDLSRKGFGFLLLSMGVSRPAAKPKPESKLAPKASGGG